MAKTIAINNKIEYAGKRHEFEKFFERTTIGKPMTPGRWINSKLTIVPVTELLLTYGGGMGGASKKVYVRRLDFSEITPDSIIEVKSWDGLENFLVNTKYVVTATNRAIGVGTYFSENYNYPVGYWQFAYLLKNENTEITTDNN